MGAQNVSAAFAMYPNLPHRAFRLLTHMALVSLDAAAEGQRARVYFGGAEALAEALGLEVGTDSTRRTVRRVLAELEAAGAIKRTATGGGGRRSEYRLALNPLAARPAMGTSPSVESEPRRAVTAPLEEGCDGPPQEGRSDPPQEGRSGPLRRAVAAPPRNHRGTTEEPRRGTTITSGGTSHLRVATTSEEVEMAYSRASAELHHRGPNVYQQAMADAAAEGLEDLRARVIRAAEIARLHEEPPPALAATAAR